MKIAKNDLESAVSNGIITAEQSQTLFAHFEEKGKDKPKFDLVHLAYYFGTLIIMSAMGWFMTKAWSQFGGEGLAAIATIYGICFIFAGRTLWYKEEMKIPGGLMFTLAVWMVPLVIFGIEKMTGMWPQGDPGHYRGYYEWVNGSWIFMEVGTILGGIIVLKYIKFPFLTFPIAVALWFLSMDLTTILFGKDSFSWDERKYVSIMFGLISTC